MGLTRIVGIQGQSPPAQQSPQQRLWQTAYGLGLQGLLGPCYKIKQKKSQDESIV